MNARPFKTDIWQASEAVQEGIKYEKMKGLNRSRIPHLIDQNIFDQNKTLIRDVKK